MNCKARAVSFTILICLVFVCSYHIMKTKIVEIQSEYKDKMLRMTFVRDSNLKSNLPQISQHLQLSSVTIDKQTNISLESSAKLFEVLKSYPDAIPLIPEVTSDKIEETLSAINKRLEIPCFGQLVNPVIQKHIKSLKEKALIEIEPYQASEEAFSKLQPREIFLSPEEKKIKEVCVRNGPGDRSRNGARFFGPGQVIRWKHHRYLGEDKLLFEVGGNWGWDAGNFSKLYNPYHIILEPLSDFVRILRKKFEGNSKTSVYNLGLGAKNETIMVQIEGHNACATSKFSGKNGTVPIYLINAVDFFASNGVGAFEVDLLTMNCEGCEYEVLEALLASNIIKHFRNVQWATHSTLRINDPIGRYCTIERLMLRTHRPTYQYRFVWESWRRRDLE